MKATYIQYAEDVLSGKVVAGELVKLACNRFFAFMDRPEYEFRPKEVKKVIDFFSTLRHYTGSHAGKPFVLQPWQQFACAGIFGFYHKKDKTRLTRYVYAELARKQGKTALASGWGLVGLIADKEMNAEIDIAANSKEQAKICFDMSSNFSKSLDPQRKYLVPFRDRIKYDYTRSAIRVFAADDSKLDGFNAHYYILDEYHSAKSPRLKWVLESSQGMRDNPLGIIITTAGFDKLGPCYEYRTMCVDVLHGLKEDDSLFPLIYCLDEGDDWKDENVWEKSNPNLGVTVKKAYLRDQVKKAINSPSEEVNVKTKNLNIWCDASDVWIPDHYILAATKDVKLENFKDCDCWIGVDLSSTSDLTAVAFMFIVDGKPHFHVKYYLPEAALTEKRFKEQYNAWRRAGYLTITPGNVTDYDYVLNDIMDVQKRVNIVSVAYDSWNAVSFATNATDAGLPMEPFSQSLGNFNRPTKELERLLLSNQCVIDNNVITRHCFRNVVLARDRNGNIKPSKQFAEKRIDGTISILQCLGSYFTTPRYGEFY